MQIAAGETQSLALSTAGDVYMWGAYKDSEGRSFRNMPPPDDTRCVTGTKDMNKLEEDENPDWFRPPRGIQEWPLHLFQMPRPAKDISAGAGFNAALLDDDTIVTWGIAQCGELARPVPKLSKQTSNEDVENVFLKPAPPLWAGPKLKRTVVTIACGGFHLLAVTRENGKLCVYSCGLNQYGQLGLGDTANRSELTKVSASPKSTVIHPFFCHSFSNVALLIPLLLKIQFFDGRDITKVDGGFHFSCFVNITGKELYTCGRGDYGQLGITMEQPEAGYLETLPLRAPLIYESQGRVSNPKENSIILENINEEDQPEIDQLSCGTSHVLVLTKGGDVYSWGFGDQGACGHGKDDKDICRPKKLDAKLKNAQGAKNDVKFVSGGGQHSTIVVTTGSAGFQP